MSNQVPVWQQQDAAKTFLDDIRGAIPLAAEQLDVILRTIRHALPTVTSLLDLGCGDGILGRTVLAEYPQATGVFLDFSAYMIETARQKTDQRRAAFVVQSLAENDWTLSVQQHAPFDLVVSGLAIHHLEDNRKRALYGEIFNLLSPGGLFLNLEHVAGHSTWANQAFDELFVDSLWSYHQKRGGTKSRDAVVVEWQNRRGKAADVLTPLDVQCRWLQESGFVDVDCFLKIFELAIFGGRKPTAAAR